MAYVSVPKDLTKVKNKLVFNLTRRQLICFALAAAIGLPFYFLTREALGTTTSATCMVLLMLPAFLFAIVVNVIVSLATSKNNMGQTQKDIEREFDEVAAMHD